MQTKNVKVEATSTDGGGIEFEIDGVKPKEFRIKLDKDSGAHAIDFELKDRTKRGLEFDRADPLWVGEDCPCPPPAGMNSDQLGIAECLADRLRTVDENSGRSRELRYQLNFVASDGSRANCDPVITNGGGTRI